MSFHLRPAFVLADGDILVPSVQYVGSQLARNARALVLHHHSLDDESGAATALSELFGGLFVPINALIIANTAESPSVFTTDVAHGLSDTDRVFISGTDGDVGDQSGVVANKTATTFELVGVDAAVIGTKGRVHEVESIHKLTAFGAVALGTGSEGVGPYIGVYVDTNANCRVNILYHEI